MTRLDRGVSRLAAVAEALVMVMVKTRATRLAACAALWGAAPVCSLAYAQPADATPADTAPANVEVIEVGQSHDPATANEPMGTAVSAPPVEMVVTGERVSQAQQLQQSAQAVHVVDLSTAKEQSADLGEVLARTQGVSVRREGGLGSSARFSLNGLTDDQVRFFLDGVPLDLAGYPGGVANVPVTLIERVEIYRGVVPIRFGADALGGVVNLVTPQRRGSRAGASYQIGSFGTQRVSVDGRYEAEDAGLVLGHSAFIDLADNDYEVDVELADARGKLREVRVPRFHDAYRAFGATLEIGVVDKPWAKRLSLQGFGSSTDKQLQHDRFMWTPYGEVTVGDTLLGTTARYDVALTRDLELAVTANYAHRIIEFRDVGQWRYDWLGARVAQLSTPGETGSASDTTLHQNAVLARAVLTWELASEHTLRASMSPTFTSRFGQRIEPSGLVDTADSIEPISQSELVTFVSGVEYEVNLWDDLFSNVAFVKDYAYRAAAYDSNDTLASHDQHRLGAGDALRVRLSPWLYAKASYEYATRLPRPDEVLGNGGLVRPNPELVPEVSHNANLGAHLEWKRTPAGRLSADINGFVRDSDRLIFLNGSALSARFENVYAARSIGVENAVSWTAPKGLATIDGTLTWLDLRNASSVGQFEDTRGDRLPNRPYLFASWGARLRASGFPAVGDSIEPFYYGRYVHSFFVGWESLGVDKQTVRAQLSHDLGVNWLLSRAFADLTLTLEVQNVTDARLYDNFGVQRPGRAYYAKLLVQLP